MPNMSYCRFENTYDDLRDCLEALDNSSVEELEQEASQYEKPYIRKLIKLCITVARYRNVLEQESE